MATSAKNKKNGTKNGVARSLARAGDPLVLPNGKVVQPVGPKQDVMKGQPAISPGTFKPTTKRVLKELPATPDVINGIACVVLYTVLGVNDREIAEALKISVAQVRDVRSMPAYGECFDIVVNEFVNTNSELIQARIAAYGQSAVTTVADVMLNGKQEVNRLRAGTEMLSMGGFSKKDAGLRGGGMNDLRIVIVDGDKSVGVEINGKEMING